MDTWPLIILVMAFTCLGLGQAANIVIYMALGSPSHKFTFVPYANALVDRGHKVTIVSSFPGSGKEKFVDMAPAALHENMIQVVTRLKVFENRVEDWLMKPITYLPQWSVESCKLFLNSPEAEALVTGKEKVDLVVIDPLANECALGLAHVNSAPHIYFSSSGMYSWQAGSFGLSSPVTFNPSPLLPRAADVTCFWHRLQMVLVEFIWGKVRSYYTFVQHRKAWEERLGRPFPDFEEMERNTSLVLINSHHVAESAQPYLSNMISVGGIHLQPAKKLPKDLEDIIQASGEDGFILFGLGSVATAKDMPELYYRAFLEAFGKLPQRIFWKWESDEQDKSHPRNVITRKWLPQNDLLGHPKCRAFVTHGGKLSTLEAIYHAVPVLVVPFFADQDLHANLAQKEGFGIYLEAANMTTENLRSSLESLVKDPSFRRQVQKRSDLLRDQPSAPLDRAVYWTEYVLRHDGVPHMRPVARHFTWYQYYLVDVWAVVILAVASVLWVIFMIFLFLYRLVWKRSHTSGKHKKMKRS